MMTRRDLMRLLLASAIAEAVDVEKLLWVPKPIITVPAMPAFATEGITGMGTWVINLNFSNDALVPMGYEATWTQADASSIVIKG